MVVGIILGSGIGLLGGVVAGNYAFSKIKPKDFMQYDLSRETDIPTKDDGKIPSDAEWVYPYLPLWTKFPDYEKTEWINQMIYNLWPYLDLAITEQVLEQAKAQLQEIVDKTPVLDAVEIEHFELGDKPIRLGGIKSYESSDYECIFEAMLMWGSSSKIRLGLRLVLGPVGIYIPVEVNDIQLVARSRITIRPLVEVLPCIGGVQVQLLETPYYDFGIHLLNKLDILALPGVELLINYIAGGVIKGIAVYPNAYSLDLMPNGGFPLPPKGMICVDVLSVDGIEGKFRLNLEVREGRAQKCDFGIDSANKGEGNMLVVDDTKLQNLKLYVTELGLFKVKTVAEGLLTFQDPNAEGPAEFIKVPGKKVERTIDLLEPGTLTLLKGVGKVAKGVGSAGIAVGKGVGKVATAPINLIKKKEKDQDNQKEALQKAKKAGKIKGQVKVAVTWQPFKTEEEEEEEQKAGNAQYKSMYSRQSSSMVRDDLKGILTVTLRRAKNLVNDQGSCDPYVTFELYDKERNMGAKTEEQQSSTILNDPDARWGEKFEFVNISATSFLNIKVQDKVGVQEALAQGNIVSVLHLSKKGDPVIGKLRIPVGDVVKNGRIRDSFPLQEVEQGELDIVLEWQKINDPKKK